MERFHLPWIFSIRQQHKISQHKISINRIFCVFNRKFNVSNRKFCFFKSWVFHDFQQNFPIMLLKNAVNFMFLIEIMNNKARHNLIDAKCRWHSDRLDKEVLLCSCPWARWRCEFQGTAWSNKSDANPPEGDTKPPGGNNP